MGRRFKSLLGFSAALLCCAGLAWAATARERSLAVYPPQVMPLRFDHKQHIEDGTDCTACHYGANKSTKAEDLLLPKHPECEECHDIQAAKKGKQTDPKAACEDCHPGFDASARKEPAKVVFPPPNLIFNHQVHTKTWKIECKVCHADVDAVQLSTRNQLPKMATCLKCHDGKYAKDACSTCHLKQPSGRLQLTFVSGVMRPTQGNPFGMDHGPRFEFNHGTQAAARRETCLECHAQRECDVCHDALQKPLSVHPNDFILLHPLQARQKTTQCESCHRHQSFCVACHERSGVGMSADRSLRPANVRVHPPASVWVDTLGPQHHGFAANRDLQSCTACHRENDCLTCHSDAERFGTRRVVSPHPSGFDKTCKAMAARNDRPCLVCHTDDALAQKGCR